MSYSDREDFETGNFIADHWAGRLSLAKSYWICGALIQSVFAGLGVFILKQVRDSTPQLRTLAITDLAINLLLLLIWLWAMVGIWRAASNHVERGGSAGWAGVAKAMVILGTIRMAFVLVMSAQQVVETLNVSVGNDPLGKMATVSPQGDALVVNGWITAGLASKIESELEANPTIKRVILTSDGGRIIEAAAIAQSIKSRNLDTVASGNCLSACTLVLLSGEKRSAKLNAIVGFHSAALPGLTDAEARAATPELRAAYLKAKLPAGFIDKAITTPASSMWVPTAEELFSSKVLNQFEADDVNGVLNLIASDVSKALPKQVDEVTTLQNATVDSNTLLYKFKVSAHKDQIVNNIFIDTIRLSSKMRLCRSHVNKYLFEAGAIFQYSYFDINGNSVFGFKIDNCK